LLSREEALARRRNLKEHLRQFQGSSLAVEELTNWLGAPFFHSYEGFNDRDVKRDLAELFLQSCPTLGWVAPHCKADRPSEGSRPLRVGFVSVFFRYHTIARLTAGFITELDRQRFKVFLFRLPGPEDQMTRTLEQTADESILLPKDFESARQEIAARELDILFYSDIGMDPWTYYLAFSRLAPVQCVTWGHPVTTGIPTIDYFLSSKDLEPADANDHYTEQLVLLDNLPAYYYRPDLREEPRSRADLACPPKARFTCVRKPSSRSTPTSMRSSPACLPATRRGT
jgi:predicted O-linked N-acetylglucosamine transferase (SPINDLY family)